MSAAALLLALLAQAPADGWRASVGLPVRVQDLVLPGGELEPLPVEPGARLVIRLDAARPHGDGFRYDLEAYALEPGEYDLGAALRRRDGTPAELPPLPFRVEALLPPGQVEPHALEPGRAPLLGGYAAALVILALLWTAGLFLLVRRGRRARVRAHAAASGPAPRTQEERVRELARRALAGELDGDGRAALERGLIALWIERLELDALDPAEALARIEAHPEAGPVLAALERWLHRAPAPDAPEHELAPLLGPYAAAPAAAQPAGGG